MSLTLIHYHMVVMLMMTLIIYKSSIQHGKLVPVIYNLRI